MNHNKILKQLRQERSLSQEDLSRGICSRTTLSSFENSNTNISLKLFQKLLERLNISIEDYFVLYYEEAYLEQSYDEYKNKVSRDLSHLYYKKDFKQLELRLQRILIIYNQNNDFFYYYLYIQYHLLINRHVLKKEINYQNDISIIKNYLDKVEVWGNFETSFFTNCLFLFDDEYIFLAMKNLSKTYHSKKGSFKFYKLYSNFIIRALTLKFERNELLNITDYLEELNRFSTTNFIKERLLYNFFSGLLLKLSQPDSNADYLIEHAINTFQILNFDAYATELAELKNSVLTKNDL